MNCLLSVECWKVDLVTCDTCGKVMDKEIQCDEDEHSISEAGVECHACSQKRAADAKADLVGYTPSVETLRRLGLPVEEDNEPDWDFIRDSKRGK